MNIKRISSGALALAGASAIAFAGLASAGPAVPGVPTADNQVCGMASDPAGNGVAGVVINGTVGGVAMPISATTNANGSYCVQGTSTLANDVIGGAKVQIFATAPAGKTITSSNPWYSTTFGTDQIDTWIFLAHLDSTYNSAVGFNFTTS